MGALALSPRAAVLGSVFAIRLADRQVPALWKSHMTYIDYFRRKKVCMN